MIQDQQRLRIPTLQWPLPNLAGCRSLKENRKVLKWPQMPHLDY